LICGDNIALIEETLILSQKKGESTKDCQDYVYPYFTPKSKKRKKKERNMAF